MAHLDRIFVAVLYTSDSDKVMRYTDEGPTEELCKWSVDLGMLPSFQMHTHMHHPNGFYTEFELGLELDSAGEPPLELHRQRSESEAGRGSRCAFTRWRGGLSRRFRFLPSESLLMMNVKDDALIGVW